MKRKEIMRTTLRILIIASFFTSQITEAQASLDQAAIDTDALAAADSQFLSNRASMEEVTGTRYYYYPNLEAYFDTRTALYIYKQNGEWITSETIDPTSRGYCVKNGMYVILKGYYDDEPYKKLASHKKEYPADFSSRPKPPVAINYAAKVKKPKAVLAAN